MEIIGTRSNHPTTKMTAAASRLRKMPARIPSGRVATATTTVSPPRNRCCMTDRHE